MRYKTASCEPETECIIGTQVPLLKVQRLSKSGSPILTSQTLNHSVMHTAAAKIVLVSKNIDHNNDKKLEEVCCVCS